MPTIHLDLQKPHKAQQQVIDNLTRFNVLDCGRRFGKSHLGIDRLITPETLSYPQAWYSPTYKMLLEIWRELVEVCLPITKRKSEQEKRIELITGGVIECWSLDSPDVARGRKYKRVIIDEAAMVKDLQRAWQAVIRPSLADYIGDAFFLSTPKGRNFFWTLYQWGMDSNKPDWSSWNYSTYDNPEIDKAEIDSLKAELPERIFRQEILAEFLEDGAGVFRNVRESNNAEWQAQAISSHQYIMGVDWGKIHDFTVLSVIDADLPALVHYERFNKIDYQFQLRRLQSLYDKFNPMEVVCESNSMGEPLIEQLRSNNLPIRAFTTTNASKSKIIEDLAMGFEKDFSIIDDEVIIQELLNYEVERLPGGQMRYNAPVGLYDDCVISLALAYSGLSNQVEVMSLGRYLAQRG